MAAFFVNTSSQYLLNSAPPITAFPFTVAMWVLPTASAIRTAFALTDSAGSADFFQIGHTATQWRISASDTAAGISNTSFGSYTPASGVWAFLVGRFISATNRRMAVFYPVNTTTGIFQHGQGTVSRDPFSVVDRMSIGALAHSAPTNFLDGNIGEFWYTNSDIQDDGAQLSNDTLWQLALGGPFSIPHICKDLLEYRSFRKGLINDTDEASEVFYGSKGIQTWTNTGGATVGGHPPLPYWYEKPGQRRNVLTV